MADEVAAHPLMHVYGWLGIGRRFFEVGAKAMRATSLWSGIQVDATEAGFVDRGTSGRAFANSPRDS